MGDNDRSTFTDPAANAPDAAALEKGKGKATDENPATQDLSMDEDEESSDEESGAEDLGAEDDDDEGHDNLEPISAGNIIEGGRRTRGKTIDFAEAAEKAKAAGDEDMDEDDEDEDFEAPDEDTKMQY